MKSIVIPAAAMSGAPRVVQESFEDIEQPDPIEARLLKPGGGVEAVFEADPGDTGGPFFAITPAGFAGSFLNGNTWPIYQARAPIVFRLRIVLNGKAVHDGDFYLRNHPAVDPIQRHALKFPAAGFPIRKGRNTLRIENRTGEVPFEGMQDFHLASIEIAESSGRIINDLHQPDALDRYIEAHPLGELKCGVGYETVLNRDVAQMIEDIAEDRVGNFLLLRPDAALNDGTLAGPEEFYAWARQLVAKRMYFSIVIFRAEGHRITPAVARRIEEIGGEYFISWNHHELGLMYMGSRRWREAFVKAPLKSLREATEIYVRAVSERIRREIPGKGRPLMCSESSILSHLNLRGGIDVPIAEITHTHCGPLIASARGAARAYGRKVWGTHTALMWTLGQGVFYGWNDARAERYRLAMKLSYLNGARVIYPESGLLDNIVAQIPRSSRKVYDENTVTADAPVQQRVRQAMREVTRLHAAHRLPGDPQVDVAFLHGNYDPFSGRTRGAALMETPGLTDVHADSGWGLLELMMPEAMIFRDDEARLTDRWFSGSPNGHCDIVPATTPAKALAHYPIAFVPGWNTMTRSMLRSWREYVAGGGVLLAAAPQLRTDEKAAEARALVNGGDVGELFGVRLSRIGHEVIEVAGRLPGGERVRERLVERDRRLVRVNELIAPHSMRCEPGAAAEVLLRETETGEPVLVRRRIGRGAAYLLTTWEYPGSPLLTPLVRRVLKDLLRGVPRRVAVESAATVAHFIYRKGRADVVAGLDTDWTCNDAKEMIVRAGGQAQGFRIPAHGVRFVYRLGDVFVSPLAETCGVAFGSQTALQTRLELFGFGTQEVEVAHAGRDLGRVAVGGVAHRTRRCGRGRSVLKCELSGRTDVAVEWR